MLHPFDSLITPNPSVVTIPALTEIETSVELNSPKTKYDGVILGALHVTGTSGEPDEGGIINEFGYALAVRMTSEPQRSIVAEIVFESAKFLAGERFTGFTMDIRNVQPELFKDTELTYEVIGEGVTVFSGSKIIDFAPNSFYPMMLFSESTAEPGYYTVNVTLKTDSGDEFVFYEQFHILENDPGADDIIGGAIPRRLPAPGAKSEEMIFAPWWFWTILCVPTILAIVLLFAAHKRKYKKGKVKPGQ
jgi:hypothetical protein